MWRAGQGCRRHVTCVLFVRGRTEQRLLAIQLESCLQPVAIQIDYHTPEIGANRTSWSGIGFTFSSQVGAGSHNVINQGKIDCQEPAGSVVHFLIFCWNLSSYELNNKTPQTISNQ